MWQGVSYSPFDSNSRTSGSGLPLAKSLSGLGERFRYSLADERPRRCRRAGDPPHRRARQGQGEGAFSGLRYVGPSGFTAGQPWDLARGGVAPDSWNGLTSQVEAAKSCCN